MRFTGTAPGALRAALVFSVGSALLAHAPLSFATDGAGAPEPALLQPVAITLPGGARARSAGPFQYAAIYTNDVLANIEGGRRRGVIDQGKLELMVSADLQSLAGVPGLSFFANGFQIHNTGRIRRDYVGGVNTIAAIEAVPATRLSELWLEQKLPGAASIRAGQLAADAEFFFSDLSAFFLQSDWPTITALNLPSGGPAYPLSTPGVRLRLDPSPNVSLLAAVFNGDPAGPGPGDEQKRNRHGLNFRVNDPPLFMAEGQFRRRPEIDAPGLAATLKLGGWLHLGAFRLSADEAAGGERSPRRWRTAGIYAVLEQQLYRPPGGAWDSGISLFGRVAFSPSHRSVMDTYVDGGILFSNMLPARPADKFGASVIHARFSSAVRAFDRAQVEAGSALAVRDYETNLELSYTAQLTPQWSVQPVLTYIWHTSGDPRVNARVAGVRFVWRL